MLVPNILARKRAGETLSDEEIRFLIEGYCRGEVKDYQMSAFAMAVAIRGMQPNETTTLTRAMLDSGEILPRQRTSDSSDSGRPRVDKHSTGGLGDKVSLVLAPLLATCDLEVPMISGRSLGLTGGTLDKLEAIDGYQTHCDSADLDNVLRECGAFIVGATEKIAPADRKLYALRDVTATVDSIPLITASILSKKLAANLDALVMDVKLGSAAVIQDLRQAVELAGSIIRVGNQSGLPTHALITQMDEPLGEAVGHAVEVNEALDVLSGKIGPVRDLTIELCADLLVRVGFAEDVDAAREHLAKRLDDGSARERFEKMVRLLGGRISGHLPVAKAHVIEAERAGFLAKVDCRKIGETMVHLGGGRRQVGDPIDHQVGICLHGRVGDHFEKSQPLMTLYASDAQAEAYSRILHSAAIMKEDEATPNPLILDHVR